MIIIPIPTSLPLALSLNRSYELINRGVSDVGIGIIIKYVNPTWPFYFEEIFCVLYRKHQDSGIIAKICVQPEEMGALTTPLEMESFSLSEHLGKCIN